MTVSQDVFRYSVPRIGSKNNILYTFNSIYKRMRNKGVIKGSVQKLSEHNFNVLLTAIREDSYSKSLDTFCVDYGYTDIKEFVSVVAKYMGIAFNNVSFTTQEDICIRAFYPYFGIDYIGFILWDVMNQLYAASGYEDVEYKMKSVGELQERVDYLYGTPYNKRLYKELMPKAYLRLNKGNGSTLVSLRKRKGNKTPFTVGERVLIEMQDIYGFNFIPWKNSYEVEYYTNPESDNSKKFKDLFIKDSLSEKNTPTCGDIVKCFDKEYAVYLELLKERCDMQVDLNWNSYLDNLLKSCVLYLNRMDDDLSTANLKVVFRPLLSCGKTVQECIVRAKVLNLRFRFTTSEVRELIKKGGKQTVKQIYRGQKGFKRSEISIMTKIAYLENLFNCKINNIDVQDFDVFVKTGEVPVRK